MEILDYSERLPKSHVPVRDEIFALSDKLSGFYRDGLFQSEGFVAAFRKRLIDIVYALPQEAQARRELEIELAYMQYALETKHGLDISADELGLAIRMLKNQLIQQWVFEWYTKFSRGIQDNNLEIDTDSFDLYLFYLYQCSQRSIDEVFRYLNTLISFSQVDGSEETLLNHLKTIWNTYDSTQVDTAIDTHNYLWGPDFPYERHIAFARLSNPEATYDEASDSVDAFIEENARFHLYIAHIWNNNIRPYFP